MLSTDRSRPWIVVVGHDWGHHTSSAQQLALTLAKSHPVLWVNSVGMRLPRFNFSDAKRIWQKIVATRPLAACGSVHVASLRVLPFHQSGLVRSINRRIIHRRVAHWGADLQITAPVVLCCVPTAIDLAIALSPKKLIYYCLDDFSTLPGVDWHIVSPYEHELVSRADMILASSPQLSRLPRFQGKQLLLFRHGVDFELFAEASNGDAPDLPTTVKQPLVKPILGFTGTLDRRIDIQLLERIADAQTGTLLLVGDSSLDISNLKTRSNVVHMNYVPYHDVPRYLGLCDVLLAPYADGPHTYSLEPLKLREYLATGKPVVATALPAFLEYSDVVSVAHTHDQFIQAIHLALVNGLSGRLERMRRAQSESWSERAKVLEEYIH